MQAKYPGRCKCGASFRPAAPGIPVEIVFDPKATPKVQGCPACNEDCAAKSKPSAAAVAVAVAVGAVALVPPGAKPVPADKLPAPVPLDPHQTKAANWASGWAVVAAGAGSGKTTTLVARVLSLLRLGALPEAVLTLVFNAAAAVTGRARLDKLLGKGLADRCRFMTFHAWGRAVLRAWGDPRAERVVGGDDGPPVKPYAQAAAKACGIREDWSPLVDLSGTIREAMINLDSDDAPDAVADLTGIGLKAAETVVRFAREYQRVKRDGCPGGPKGVLDFSDMLCDVAAEIREGTPRAKALCAAYAHVQVDEGQDGNAVRQFIGRSLGGGSKSLITVGDLRQSVYGFTGARPDMFQALAGESTLLVMPVNYRSGRAIVALGNAIARGRTWNLGGDCEARPDAPEGKIARVACPGGDEAGWVATDVAARMATPPGVAPVALTEIAVLARTNAALATAEAALHRRGIPARLSGRKGGIWASSVGRCVLAYLRCAEGKPEADAKLISNRPCRYAVGTAVAEAVAKGGDFRDALRTGGDRGCERLARDLRALSRLDWAARCAEVGEYLLADLDERAADASAAAGQALAPDDDRAALIKALCKVATEAGDLAKLDEAVAESANLPKDAPAVTLITAHRAKGSEWRHVYILGADAGLFPHANATGAEEEEEERRLFYVAVTRAIDTLTVVHGPMPSPFLDGLTFPGDAPTPPTGGGKPVEVCPHDVPVCDACPECPEPPPELVEAGRLPTGEDAERAEREAVAADGLFAFSQPPNLGAAPGTPAFPATDEVASDPFPEPTLASPAAPEPTPILAAIEATLPAAEAAAALEPKAADGSRYVPVALDSFATLLAPLGAARASSEIEAKMRQVVYTIPLADGCQIRVYTTVPANEADARGCGEDSIKVALLAPDGTGGYTPLMGRLPYACRTRGWRSTLLGKIKLAVREWMAAPRCPRCDAPMARRKGPRGDFYGCTRYARGTGCRNTLPLPKDASPAPDSI